MGYSIVRAKAGFKDFVSITEQEWEEFTKQDKDILYTKNYSDIYQEDYTYPDKIYYKCPSDKYRYDVSVSYFREFLTNVSLPKGEQGNIFVDYDVPYLIKDKVREICQYFSATMFDDTDNIVDLESLTSILDD